MFEPHEQAEADLSALYSEVPFGDRDEQVTIRRETSCRVSDNVKRTRMRTKERSEQKATYPAHSKREPERQTMRPRLKPRKKEEEGMQNRQSTAHATITPGGAASTGHQYGTVHLSGNSAGHLGDVLHHHHYYNHTEQGPPVTLLHPSCRIPFRHDRDFVERFPFHEIYQCAIQPSSRVGVVGLGGIGKTQLAVEYAYRRRAAEPQLWVFWVHASSTARFEQSYRQIAEQVRIDDWADPKADVLNMVRAWLCDETNGAWTMVVDNADDSDVVFGPDSKVAERAGRSSAVSENALSNHRSIVNYLPACSHGSILITSRNREVVNGLIEYAEDIFEVGPMYEEDAIALLKKKLKKSRLDDDQTALTRLVQQLDYMPLAIAQAAAYINEPGSRMTVSRYSDQLTRSDLDRDRLLAKGLRDPRRDGESSNSIVITWHASFERIRQTRASAARLLSLMSLFDRQGIPKRLLQGRYLSHWRSERGRRRNSTRINEAADFEDDVNTLFTYQLVTVDASGELFEMHRLVQYSTRKWLELHNEATYWQERYIDILEMVFPTGDYTNWPTCNSLFPHAERILAYRAEDKDHILKRATIMYRGAWYAKEIGQYHVAKQMVETSLSDRKSVLGETSKLTLDSLNMLAIVLKNQGRYDAAEEINRRALIGMEKKVGPTHPDTLTTMSNLAMVLADQGKYEAAEELDRRALAGTVKLLGPTHPDALTSMSNLAMVLADQGKYEAAEEMNRRALAGTEKLLGPTHPDTLISVSNLAIMLQEQGKYDAAEAMNRRALINREKELGMTHPDTLKSLYCLAHLKHAQRQFEEALRLYNRAIEGYIQVLGRSHPTTQACQRHKSLLLRDMK